MSVSLIVPLNISSNISRPYWPPSYTSPSWLVATLTAKRINHTTNIPPVLFPLHPPSLLSHFMEGLSLTDIWRLTHPDRREFAFFSRPHHTLSRIDYTFANAMQSRTTSDVPLQGPTNVHTHSHLERQPMRSGHLP